MPSDQRLETVRKGQQQCSNVYAAPRSTCSGAEVTCCNQPLLPLLPQLQSKWGRT